MVSIIGLRIHFDGVKVLRGQRHLSEKKINPSIPPPGKNDINTLSEKYLTGEDKPRGCLLETKPNSLN